MTDSVEWETPVKDLKEALTKLEKGCGTLQFEHRLDPYSDGDLDFTRNNGGKDKILNPHLGNEGVVELCAALKKNKTCKALDLSGNKISSEGVGALCDLLATNEVIEILYLEDNRIDDSDVKFIAETLRKNKALKQLCLSGNRIGSKGASALAKALKKNKALEALWLNRNEIRDEGAKALGRALKKKNKHLDTLCLEENRIRERGGKTLAKALKKNKDLKTLNLGGNKINAKGAKYFKKAVKKNKGGLECLVLDGNRINLADLELIKSKAGSKNITIQGRNVYEEAPRDRGPARIVNYVRNHMMNPKYAKQGHFDPDREIERVL